MRPADFRRPIERAFATPTGLGAIYYASIVGAKACVKTPKRCDLSTGIVDDPAANTVTFHLAAPDPDLLYKLALPPAFAVPASTPVKAQLPLPATGPYHVVSYDRKRGRLRLARNPRFHEWSAAAQPNGYPDEIIWQVGLSDKAGLRAVERGTADLTGVDPAHLSALRTRYQPQLHINPRIETDYVFLNTRLPPFDDVRVRRAVNFAVDRNRLVELGGGPDLARPSCQVLPPNLDGYRRYCPYTLHRRPGGAGPWTAPDLASARRLIVASGTKGQTVTVWVCKCIGAPQGAYMVSVLRKLGYNARLKIIKNFPVYLAAVGDSRRKIQASSTGWAVDYPSANNFFSPLFTCASFHPRSSANQNAWEFCDRRIDAEITHARALQTSDPHAASQLWSKIDHDITDRAPWVVETNPQWVDFVSRHVGNYQYNPQWGALLDQLWVR